jgi:hypothetical protein
MSDVNAALARSFGEVFGRRMIDAAAGPAGGHGAALHDR